jgi:hypothetical protein
MFGKNSKRQKAGQPIAARTINKPAGYAQKNARFRVGSGLQQTDLGGIPLIRRREIARFWVQITGAPTGGAHPWQAQQDTPGGGFDPISDFDDAGGTDPLYEVNGNTIPTNTYVEAIRGRFSGVLLAQVSACS